MAGKTMMAVVGISGVLDKSFEKAVGAAQEKISGISPKALKVSAALAGIGTAGLAAGKEILKFGDNYNKALQDMQNKTGASASEMKELGKVVQDVYGAGFGEDINAVADGVATLRQQTGLAGKELQNTSKGAFALSETFGYDIAESARASRALMQNFGISGDEAMNLIATGAQNGLDYSGELLDSISEYSVQFQKIGLDANDMFSVFQQGADSGAWNLDKVGDAVKEFSIRSIDGSDSTKKAYQDLGLNADKMMQTFAAGGPQANKAFDQVVNKLISVDDEVQRDAIGVALFGTMWEDLGVDAVKALANTGDEAYATKNAIEEMEKSKLNTLSGSFESIQRSIEVGLLPLASAFAAKLIDLRPTIESVIGFVIDNTNVLIPLVGSLGAAYAGLKFANLINGAKGLGNAFKFLSVNKMKDRLETAKLIGMYAKEKAAKVASTAATKTWTVVSKGAAAASRLLGSALRFMTGPIGWIVTGIGLAVAAGISLYRNWDTVKEKALAFAGRIKGIFVGIKNGIVGAFTGIKEKVGAALGGLASIVKSPINAVISIVNKMIDSVNTLSFDIPDWVPGIGGDTIGFNIPHLSLLATGGFTNGPSIAGEAGQEAVISFDPAYRKQNISYWAKAGRMLGATDDDTYLLSSGTTTTISLGGITFAPNITVSGSTKKEDIIAAIEEEEMEFMDRIEEFFARRGRFVYE